MDVAAAADQSIKFYSTSGCLRQWTGIDVATDELSTRGFLG